MTEFSEASLQAELQATERDRAGAWQQAIIAKVRPEILARIARQAAALDTLMRASEEVQALAYLLHASGVTFHGLQWASVATLIGRAGDRHGLGNAWFLRVIEHELLPGGAVPQWVKVSRYL